MSLKIPAISTSHISKWWLTIKVTKSCNYAVVIPDVVYARQFKMIRFYGGLTWLIVRRRQKPSSRENKWCLRKAFVEAEEYPNLIQSEYRAITSASHHNITSCCLATFLTKTASSVCLWRIVFPRLLAWI